MQTKRCHVIADSLLKWEPLYAAPLGLLPLFILGFVPRLDSIGLVGLTVCFTPWILRRWRRGYFSRRTPFDLVILIFLLGALGGLYASVMPEVGVARLLNLLGGVLGYYLVINNASKRSLSLFLTLFTVGCLVVILVTMSQVPGADKYTSSGLLGLVKPLLGLFDNLPKFPMPIYEEAYPFRPAILRFVVVLIPYTLIFSFWGRRSSRVASGALTAFFVLLLLLTSMRGSLLALIAGLLIMGVYWKPRVILSLPVVGLAAYGLLLSPFLGKTQSTLEMLANPSNFSRLDSWQLAWWVIQDFPYTGSGLGLENWYRVLPLYGMIYWGPEPPRIHVHNFYLQTYIEQGILGFVGLIAIVIVAFWMGWRFRRQTQSFARMLILGSMGSFAVLLLSSLTDSMPSTPLGILLFFWPLSMMVGAILISQENGSHSNRLSQQREPSIDAVREAAFTRKVTLDTLKDALAGLTASWETLERQHLKAILANIIDTIAVYDDGRMEVSYRQ